MKWIAKNAVTGETFGNIFNCIYDCQDYIDKSLSSFQGFDQYGRHLIRCYSLDQDRFATGFDF